MWTRNPDYSLFNDDYFHYPFDGKFYRRFAFEIARGCPYSCSYCGNTALKKVFEGLGKLVRIRSVDSAIEGFNSIIKSQNIELLYLMDECFMGHPAWWLQEFAAQYAKRIRLPFIAQTRPETVTSSKLDILYTMGASFYQVSLGVESGSERILSEVCKRHVSKKRIQESFDLLHDRHIRTSAFFMIGLPYEIREEIFESIRLCRDIKSTVAEVNIFQPLPGQELRELCIRKDNLPVMNHKSFTEVHYLKMPQITSEEIFEIFIEFLCYMQNYLMSIGLILKNVNTIFMKT